MTDEIFAPILDTRGPSLQRDRGNVHKNSVKLFWRYICDRPTDLYRQTNKDTRSLQYGPTSRSIKLKFHGNSFLV